MLSALASHPEVARELSPSMADIAQEALAMLLAHPRVGVWSRAARALGRLAGFLGGAAQRMLALLQGAATPVMRLRATAALGSLSAAAGHDLLTLRAAALRVLDGGNITGETSAHETAVVAALAVALPDLCLDENQAWPALARRIAARGGPEAWLAVLRALQEIRLRDPSEQGVVEPIAHDVRARAELWRGGGGADAERVERALALANRIAAADDRSPGALVADLARAVSSAPNDPLLRGHVDAFVTEMDVLLSSSARAVGSDNARVASQGSVALEELVDLVVDGELPVIAGRVAEAAAHAAADEAAESLRTRLLRMVWTGLRRPTPSAFAWRRWLIRAAGSLPRSLPPGQRQAEVERDQVFETLERLADDPLFGQPVLLRYLGATLAELSQPLLLPLGPGASASVLVWLALHGSLSPAHVRLKRWLNDEAPAEAVDRLFELMETSDRAHRDVARDVATLGVIAGGDACRMGVVLAALGAECVDLAQRRPEAHWSGLPRFDLTDLASLADTLRRARDEAAFALTLEGERPSAAPGAPAQQGQRAQKAPETLVERAGRINRMLTTTSLKFMDVARRAEVVEHYLSELSSLSEAIASACGPLVATGLRAMLAKAIVAVRAQANASVREQKAGVRYIARLRVLGELSSAHEGGMTSTFLAEGGAPGKKLVVKLLRWEKFRGTSAELARAMFEGEMERLAGVVHPNIVSIIDAGVVDEGAYIALEYIPGASLETLLRKLGRVELRALAPMVRDVARALTWLHARKIIHRDIKPGNIILQLDLAPDATLDAKVWSTAEVVRAVLIDFGVATELTRLGSNEGVTGTPGYIAPEIARGLNLFGPPVDMYAMGVVIFEMLTGFNPFLEGDPQLNAVLVRHGSMALPWQKLPPEAQAKPDLVQLLAETTRIDPRMRPTMKDFLTRWSKSLGLGV
jgi:serine/threonine protein kinase